MKAQIEEAEKPETQKREEARVRHQRQLAWAEEKRQRQLAAPKSEVPRAEPQEIVKRPAQAVDFEERQKNLKRQADEILKKFPASRKRA